MKNIFPLLLIALVFAACGSSKNVADSDKHTKKQDDTVKKWTYNRVLKTNDYEIKYTKAIEYYNDQRYVKALDVFEQLVPHEKGQTRGEEVYFLYCMCNFKIGDYLYAAYHFNEFYEAYPNSKFSQQALFLSAYCYYLESPRWSLDQEPTNEAINQFQLFLSKFPQSNLVDSSNTLIDTLRFKLEEKAYRAAKLYYDLEYYQAADVALNNAINDYPDSPFNEDALYYTIKADYKYAHGSIKHKQKERFELTIKNCQRYIKHYPSGHYIKEINKIMEDSKKNIL